MIDRFSRVMPMARRLLRAYVSSRHCSRTLAAALSLTAVAVLEGQNLLSSYRSAAQSFRDAAAKAPADERPCYLAFANYYDCVAAQLGPNPPANCVVPQCTMGSPGGSGAAYGSTPGGGPTGTTGMLATNQAQEQVMQTMAQTLNALAASADAKQAERNARQRAALAVSNRASDAERLRQEQAEADRQQAVTNQFLNEMRQTFVPLAFRIKSSPESSANDNGASGAYVQAGIRALDAIDYKAAAARFTDALHFSSSGGDDVRLAAASTLVLAGEYSQAAQQLTKLQRSTDPKYAQESSDLLTLLTTRGESFRWALIENSRNRDDFAVFLRDYPAGHFFESAQGKFFELDAARKRDAYIAAHTKHYDVWHLHSGFGANPAGRVTVAPNRVAFEELGNIANLEHSFDMTCNDIEKVTGNPLGILGDRRTLWVKVHGKGFTFNTDSRKVANELIDLIKSTCSLR